MESESQQERRFRLRRESQRRRRQVRAPHSTPATSTLGPENELPGHCCGEMNIVCQFCRARHFLKERPADHKFTHCCHKGAVPTNLNPDKPFPRMLEDLMSRHDFPGHANFKENIRSYNSALAFASMGASIAPPPGHGPYTFRVHGQIYHTTSHMDAPVGEAPQYAQLYVLDPTAAAEFRFNRPENERCDYHVMAQLETMLRQINPFARAYRMLGEIEKEEQQKAMDERRPARTVSMSLITNRGQEQGRYNLPTANEVAMIFVDRDGEPPMERDIRIYPRTPHGASRYVQIGILDPKLDPMTYPIFYPNGELGWEPNPIGRLRNENRKRVTMLQFKQYQLADRGTFNPILHGGRLTQQWIVDSYLQVEANNLNYLRYNQAQLRTEQYHGLMDHIHQEAALAGAHVGKALILPSSFQGSPRNMHERFHDAMAIVCCYGKPDILLTFTCNPNWAEIKDNLYAGQTPSDRPDLVARVFNLKLQALMEDLVKNEVLGRVDAYVYTIEFQKRGLPHAHLLLMFADGYKPKHAEEVDSLVSAEIPDRTTHPKLFEIVTGCMIHGPCGTINRNSPCMVNGACSKKFPKPFRESTNVNVTGYPLYKRREEASINIKGKPVDNWWVVPYNPWLTLKYNAHINVEICTSMSVVKYLFKYICKGYDCASVDVAQKTGVYNHDEIRKFVDARYVSAPEGAWRLFENKMHDRSHSINQLPVHLPNMQTVTFQPGQEIAAVERAQETKLTAWFNLNITNSAAREFLYTEIPKHFVFGRKEWKQRQRGGEKVISRMYPVLPRDQERFFLRILLLHVRGATSFEDLRTVDGTTYDTFHEAAKKRNLLQGDEEWSNALIDASVTSSSKLIRDMFAYILVFCSPGDPLHLWNTHKGSMTEDYLLHHSEIESEQLALMDLKELLAFHGVKLPERGLPEPQLTHRQHIELYDPEVEWENYLRMSATFNELQKEAFDELTHAIENPLACNRSYYLDGPGGSGKTYLYTALISWVKGKGGTVIPHATTGIAALLLPAGRTAHSGFKLPVPINETSTSSMRPRSDQVSVLREAKLLIIDEASMLQSHGLRCIDKLLKEIMCDDVGNPSQLPFGGKLLLLGGDFRQTLPVVPCGTRAQILEACIKSSSLWRFFKQLHLSTNMRTGGIGNEFTDWLLRVGNGTETNDAGLEDCIIEIPPGMVELDDLVKTIFGDAIELDNVHRLANTVILTSTNEQATKINEKVLKLLPGLARTYYSADSIVSDDPGDSTRFPVEFLNRQTPSGMPIHALTLKVGAIVMLMRNLNRKLCNGTRLIVKAMHDRFLDLEVLTGSSKGERIILSRIDLAPTDSQLPFVFKRRQFPIRLAFAMTINKSQGQTFDVVGLHLHEPVFSHGQLYVALSRVRSPQNLKVKVVNGRNQGELIAGSNRVFTRNVVFKEVLQDRIIPQPLTQEMTSQEWEELAAFELGYDDPTFNTYLYETTHNEEIALNDDDMCWFIGQSDPDEILQPIPTDTAGDVLWFNGEYEPMDYESWMFGLWPLEAHVLHNILTR